MATITVFSPQRSNRLLYVLRWLFKDVLNTDYRLVHDENEIASLPFFISYGKHFPNALTIPDTGLLWETNISSHTIDIGEWKGIPTLYHKPGSINFTVPFDLFSAIFFLTSRYEEYLDYAPDKHDRYPATESLLFKNCWLERPLIDEWILEFYRLLEENSEEETSLTPFIYQPTYDIDIAFSYKHKGWIRSIGGFAKDLLSGKLKEMSKRMLVLAGLNQDPYDSFSWLHQLHSFLKIHPVYFILVALDATANDKNNDPRNSAMQKLIKEFSNAGGIGLHPSYYSFKEEVFQAEKSLLETTTGSAITKSRQHYIRLKIPETYYQLLQMGIPEDFSMGYGSKLGFRAGTGRSFFWYDLRNEKTTDLRIHPFCFMDSTARFEERLSVAEAFSRLNRLREILEQTHSQMITVFHNFSLGTDEGWKGWADAYQRFLQNIYQR